jgi:hypothetical protein
MHLRLQVAQTNRDLGDDAGDPFGIGDVVDELLTGELAHLAAGKHDPGRGDVLLERPVLVRPEAGSALGQPTGDRR